MILKNELEELKAQGLINNLNYTLDKVTGKNPENFYQGYINEEMLKETMPAPSKETMIMYSGTEPMNAML